MTAPDLRRARWNTIVERHRIAGLPVEQSPVFLAWIEEWIEGSIDMALVQMRYVAWMSAQRQPGLADAGPTADRFVAELGEEIPDIAGLRIRDPQTRLRSTQAIAEAWAPD